MNETIIRGIEQKGMSAYLWGLALVLDVAGASSTYVALATGERFFILSAVMGYALTAVPKIIDIQLKRDAIKRALVNSQLDEMSTQAWTNLKSIEETLASLRGVAQPSDVIVLPPDKYHHVN